MKGIVNYFVSLLLLIFFNNLRSGPPRVEVRYSARKAWLYVEELPPYSTQWMIFTANGKAVRILQLAPGPRPAVVDISDWYYGFYYYRWEMFGIYQGGGHFGLMPE